MWKPLLSYSSVLSLAAQSSRWEHAMQEKLVELAAAAEKAAMLQVSAQEQQTLAFQIEETVTVERAEAAELEEEASILLENAEADVVLAAGEQVQAEGMAAEAATEEEQSLAHAAKAALDETTADTELAEATADAAQAARAELQAHGEEVGIGICEFVPGLDVLCSVVGGVTAVGTEGFAAGEGVKASGELAAASLAKAHEEREIAMAAEFQAKAMEDSTASAELESQQVAEEEVAEGERIAGEEKQAQAEALLEHAEVEADSGVEEEAMAGEEMDEAASLLAYSISRGVSACWDGIMATLFGIVAFLFFGLKTIAKIFPPMLKVLSDPTPTSVAGGVFVRNTSYNFHHSLIFLLNSGIFSNLFEIFGNLSLRARGGLVLGFAATGAGVQTLALHLVPGYLSLSHSWKSLFSEVVRSLVCLSFLFALELLILWAAFGERLFTSPLLQSLKEWVWWVMFLVPLGCHLVFLEIPHVSRREGLLGSNQEPSECIVNEPAKESDSLLPTKAAFNGTHRVVHINGWWSQVRADLAKMQLPFEILMATCMTGLLIHCIGATMSLWPTSKALLLTNRPGWLSDLATVVAIVAICVILVVAWRRRKQEGKV